MSDGDGKKFKNPLDWSWMPKHAENEMKKAIKNAPAEKTSQGY